MFLFKTRRLGYDPIVGFGLRGKMNALFSAFEVGGCAFGLLASYYILGTPFVALTKMEVKAKRLFSILIGMCVSLPLTFGIYALVGPSYRHLGLQIATLMSLLAALLIKKSKKSQNGKLWDNFSVLTFFYLTLISRIPFHHLKDWAGIYSGNGDLAYYSALARYLAQAGTHSLGWITGTSMQQDLFGNWGYGGGGGAASLTFSSLTLGQSVVNIILPTFVSYCLILIFGIYLILDFLKVDEKIKILLSIISVLNIYIFYLASQGFTQMFISMIGVELLVLIGLIQSAYPAQSWLSALPIFLFSAVASYIQYLCYPILGAPFMIFYLFGVVIILFNNKRYGRVGVHFGYWAAIAGSFLPLLIWPQRIQIVIDQISVFTSGAPGWNYMVARPTSMFFATSMGGHWKWSDYLLISLLLGTLIIAFNKTERRIRNWIAGFILVDLILVAVFGVRDGFQAYTTWKASYFATPFILCAAFYGVGFILKSKIHALPKQLYSFFLIFVIIAMVISDYRSVINRSIPLTRFPIAELHTLESTLMKNNHLTVALGPLDQLWAIEEATSNISPISPNIHVAQKSSFMKKGEYLIVYSDDPTTLVFCKGLNLSDFDLIRMGHWYKLISPKKDMEITCLK